LSYRRSSLRSQVDEDARLRRCTRLAGYKALVSARKAFGLEEQISFRSMSEVAQKRWRERRQLVEGELKRIAELLPP
jgi:hypothetical protein